MKNYCCEKLAYYLTGDEISDEIALEYSASERRFGISVLDGEHESRGGSVIIISHCPWCGTEFPKELTKTRMGLLYNMFEDLDGFLDPRIPNEFKTDEWWKKRGL